MSWRETLKYILDETENIHRFYSWELEWCFLSDVNGKRYKIDSTMTIEQISSVIETIKLTNLKGSGMRDMWNKIISN